MRKLKFRAWVDDSTLCNDIEIEKHLDENGDFIPFMAFINEWYMDDGQMLGSFLSGFGEEQIMQYTGVKDKNGIDIYEGDLCVDEIGDKYEVIFMEGRFILLGIGTRFVRSGVEVIGNIYENPELLEEWQKLLEGWKRDRKIK